MHLRKLISTCFFASLFCIVQAQQNNIWYFGRKAGLNFNGGGQPQVLSNSAMDSDEGCASVCDKSGNLLFYTNGVTVYNRNHQPMLNGNSLLGNVSAVQGSLIIPQPGSDSLYYIFTADAIQNNFANGYTYSVVDISKDNGNGEVISKNNLLDASGTERMTAVRHADGISVWLITNENYSNTFKAWLINCNGLQPGPVVSVTGDILNQFTLMNVGMLKASPDGTKLCQTHFPLFDETSLVPNFFQLFDFNNATGVISNPKRIGFNNSQYTNCEFSPDSKLLYLVQSYARSIDQLEITLPSVAAIAASRVTINTNPAGYFGIQLAPDGKIYLAFPSTFLGAINNPDVKGTGCNFQLQQVNLAPGSGYIGLPSYLNDFSFSATNSFSYLIADSCSGAVQFQGVASLPGTIQWAWDFGDGTTSTLQNPSHTFTPSKQSYKVTLRITSSMACGDIITSKNIVPSGVVAKTDFDVMANCDSGYARFTNKNPSVQGSSAQFIWDFGDGNSSTDTDPVHFYAQPGNYTVKLKLVTTTACLNDSMSKTIDIQQLNIQATPDQQQIDLGQTVQLNVTGGGSSFNWSPRTGLSNPAIANPVAKPDDNTTYIVTVKNEAGCTATDSVVIKVTPLKDIFVPSGFTPNNDGKNDLFKPLLGSAYTLKEFSIFNRWGQRVFITSQKGAGWNGKIKGVLQDSGIFIWVISAVERDGTLHKRKGTFVLIR